MKGRVSEQPQNTQWIVLIFVTIWFFAHFLSLCHFSRISAEGIHCIRCSFRRLRRHDHITITYYHQDLALQKTNRCSSHSGFLFDTIVFFVLVWCLLLIHILKLSWLHWVCLKIGYPIYPYFNPMVYRCLSCTFPHSNKHFRIF